VQPAGPLPAQGSIRKHVRAHEEGCAAMRVRLVVGGQKDVRTEVLPP